jgi:hypothetical protein
MLIAAIFNILFLAAAFTRIVDLKEILRFTWTISPLPYIGLATAFGGNTILSSSLAVIYVIGILLSVVGGVLALKRKAWGLVLIGSLGALCCVGSDVNSGHQTSLRCR